MSDLSNFGLNPIMLDLESDKNADVESLMIRIFPTPKIAILTPIFNFSF